jgi:Zn-dependent peptidase ImmA (M78 family)
MEPRDIVDGIIEDAHERLCSFIASALACDLQVELTAVERPDVDKVKTQELATQLGVTTQVRWRPYFP